MDVNHGTAFRAAAREFFAALSSFNFITLIEPKSLPDAIGNAIGYAKFYSRSHDAVIRVYDDAGNVIETHEHTGDFKEW